jgi:hypothetical protein
LIKVINPELPIRSDNKGCSLFNGEKEMNHCEISETGWLSVVDASRFFNQPISTVIRRAGNGELCSRISSGGKLEIRSETQPSGLEQYPQGMVRAGIEHDKLAVIDSDAGAIQAKSVFEEARALVKSCREEMEHFQEYRKEEVRRLKISGRIAWSLTAAAIIIISICIYSLYSSSSSLEGLEMERDYLKKDLVDRSSKLDHSATLNESLGKTIERYTESRIQLARELGKSRREHAASIGQLTAFRSHSVMLSGELEKTMNEKQLLEKKDEQNRAQIKLLRDKVNTLTCALGEQDRAKRLEKTVTERRLRAIENNSRMSTRASTPVQAGPRNAMIPENKPVNYDVLRREDMRLSELRSALTVTSR